jgi:XTP/dITP diphosphohydrolase
VQIRVSDEQGKWVIATGNRGKEREIREILEGTRVEVCSLAAFDPITFPEEGLEYEENAIVKARVVAERLGEIAVADDSGIEVFALDGAPGPLSARYGGESLDDAGRVEKLLGTMDSVPDSKRGARFVCVAALATPEGDTVVARGECPGRILRAPRGSGGFGYDPVFQPEEYDLAMAEISSEVKNEISHRARAFRELWRRWTGL